MPLALSLKDAKVLGMMKTEDAIARAGGATALAALLDITPSAVSQWGEDVPQPRYWQLRVLRPAWFKETKDKPVSKMSAV